MSQIKEIIVFSVGDSLDLKTWSNVPFFFTKSLEEKKIKVHRVNIEENSFLNTIYKYTVFACLKLFYKNSNHTYFRSGLNYFLTNLKIRKALKKYDKADVHLFLTYSFSSKNHSSKKTVLFSDWSYLYYLKTFLNRNPYWFEKKALKREEEHINSAETVVSLFPKSRRFNIQNYANEHQYYLGNVINSNYQLDKKTLIDQKIKSNKLLFIGNKKYIHGAIELINVFKEISKKNTINSELHIIGLEENETGMQLPGLFYYGYLNKGVTNENELYYKLISEAKVIINTNKDWGAFSAITEAMYFYTPVITTPYEEFIETYGADIDFGYYVNNNTPEELASKIENILTNSSDYQIQLMNTAHEKVKDFSWNNYSNKILELITNV